MSPIRASLVVVALGLLAGCPPADEGKDAGPQCTSVASCPSTFNECSQPVCTNGVCGVLNIAAGTVLSSQTDGDCQRRECDGAGHVVSVVEVTDVKSDDNDCTVDACNGQTPTHTNTASGTSCGANQLLVCNGSGQCFGCASATDCDGAQNECATPACTDGMCGFTFAAQGTALTAQTAGDCEVKVCDGTGSVTSTLSDLDVPVDGNPCTDDLCSGATPSNPPLASGLSCSADGGAAVCDGAGVCVGCNLASDCAGQDTFCLVRTCTNHACGTMPTGAGTALPSQTSFDCKKVVCDGTGGSTVANDDADLPVDNNACTDDVCSNGAPMNPPKAAGSSCGTALICNATGQCQGCNQASDCPGTSSECSTITCTNGTCGATNAPVGTASSMQISGDCRKAQCDGNGNRVLVTDDVDVPVDAQQCTQDLCTNGVPSHAPVATGSACTQNGGSRCSATGTCVQCLAAADCGSSSECVARSCSSAGACVTAFADAGTPVSAQTTGDCKQRVCAGDGGVQTSTDNSDLPVDSQQCTNDVCTNGVPSNPPLADRTACVQNGGSFCSAGACVACTLSSDCGSSTECLTRVCSSGSCGAVVADAGTPVSAQTAGDCKQNVCAGDGGTTIRNDDIDAPADDGNQCTGESCSGGTPSHPASPSGTVCSQSGGTTCDGNASCVQCTVASQCPGSETECQTRTCTSGACGFSFTAAGTPVSAQTTGDCASNVCNGSGAIVAVASNTDLPVDSNQCTGDVCTSGVPSNPPLASGAACNQNGGTSCDGAGACVAAAPAPTVVSVSPAQGASNVAINASIVVTFSTAMNPSTLTVQSTAGACSGSIQLSADDFVTCVALTAPVFSAGNTVATATAALAKSTRYRVRVTTVAASSAGSTLATAYAPTAGFFTVPDSSACGVVISQVFGAGGNAGAPWKNDFIEIKNLGTSTIDLTNWSVQYAAATGTNWSRTNLSGTIAAGQYLLVQEGGADGGAALPAADFTGSLAMSGTAGKVALVSTGTLSGACPDAGVVDLVGFGGANCYEGSAPTPVLSTISSAARGGFSCNESNDNAGDFMVSTPVPHNGASPHFSCSACGVVNETNAGSEADFCNVQFPTSLSVNAGAPTGLVFGQLYEGGVTEAAGSAATVIVQIGYGPDGVNPLTQSGWQFFPATFNVQIGNNDEYQGEFTAPSNPGAYRYGFRFSIDNGSSWTFADLDGAGSNAGLDFSTAQLPLLTVN